VNLELFKPIGQGDVTTAVQWGNNPLLLREADKWICFEADRRYGTPAECLFNRVLFSFLRVSNGIYLVNSTLTDRESSS